MCLATPAKIIKIKGSTAEVKDSHGQKKVNLILIKKAQVGDYLLVHADLAINKLPENEAKEILKLNNMCHHKEENNVSHHSRSSSQS